MQMIQNIEIIHEPQIMGNLHCLWSFCIKFSLNVLVFGRRGPLIFLCPEKYCFMSQLWMEARFECRYFKALVWFKKVTSALHPNCYFKIMKETDESN